MMRHHCLHLHLLIVSALAVISLNGQYHVGANSRSSPLSMHLKKDLSLALSHTKPLHNSVPNIHNHHNNNHNTSKRLPFARVSNMTTQQLLRRRRRGLQQELVQQTTTTSTATATSASSEPPLKAFYYFIQALGKSNNTGCHHPQPAFMVTCPIGAFIVSQSSRSEWNSRIDCYQNSDTQIRCIPKDLGDDPYIDMDDQNGVTVGCYGHANTTNNETDGSYNYDNLQVSVQVDGGLYVCDKAIEAHATPIPTVVTGGNVYQTVAIQKQCLSYSSTEQQPQETWVFVEPTCDMVSSGTARESVNDSRIILRQTAVPVQFGNDETQIDGISRESTNPTTVSIAHCEIADDCHALYSCQDHTCTGATSCFLAMPSFVSNSTTAVTDIFLPDQVQECLPRDFTVGLGEGQLCEFNLMCSSGICLNGTCQPYRLPPKHPCEEHDDCLLHACGKVAPENATADDMYNDKIPVKTCCPSGQIFGHEGYPFCTATQPIGAPCKADAMCESNICIFDTCRETLLDDGMECEESVDCVGGVCANYHDETGRLECCATGDSIFLSDGPKCSNRAGGDSCENNTNSLCQSNICVQGICQDIPQDVGDDCDNHFDCLNGACGLESAFASAPYICCPTGAYLFVPQPEEVIIRTSTGIVASNSLRVCTGQPDGAPCSGGELEHNALCDSGLCILGICRSERQLPGAVCFENDDCEFSVCAFASLEASASKVCCETNEHKSVYLSDRLRLTDVCTGQPLGARCGDIDSHAICASGNCTNGVCVESSTPYFP